MLQNCFNEDLGGSPPSRLRAGGNQLSNKALRIWNYVVPSQSCTSSRSGLQVRAVRHRYGHRRPAGSRQSLSLLCGESSSSSSFSDGPADGVHQEPDPPAWEWCWTRSTSTRSALWRTEGWRLYFNLMARYAWIGTWRRRRGTDREWLRASGTAIRYPGNSAGPARSAPYTRAVLHPRHLLPVFGSVPAGIRNARLGSTFDSSTASSRTNPRAPTKFGGAAESMPRRPRR